MANKILAQEDEKVLKMDGNMKILNASEPYT